MALGSYAAAQLRSYPTSWEFDESTTRPRALEGPRWPWMALGNEAATQLHRYTAAQLPHKLGVYESIRLELGPWMALGDP